MSLFKDYLHLNFIVVIWGFTAILGLLISIPPVEVVFYRTLFSSLALVLIIRFSKGTFEVDRRSIIKMLLTGVIIGAHWILFFASARASNVSICLIGMATVALWTSFLEPLSNKKKINLFEVFLGLVIIVGLYIIYNVNLSYKMGLIMAVISALLSAIFSVINGKFTKKHHHLTITLYEMIGACITSLLFIPLYVKYFSETGVFEWQMSWSDFGYLLILALVCTVYAFSVSVELLKRISVFMSNLFIHMEPVYGILLAVLIFQDKERMNTEFYIGSAIIVLAVFTYPVVRYYQRKNNKITL